MLTGNSNEIPEIKKGIVKNNIAEEFIAMRVDLDLDTFTIIECIECRL
jgi:hypothetical protein